LAHSEKNLKHINGVRFPINTFYPRDAILARVFATATCRTVRPSVCLSVTSRYCVKTSWFLHHLV